MAVPMGYVPRRTAILTQAIYFIIQFDFKPENTLTTYRNIDAILNYQYSKYPNLLVLTDPPAILVAIHFNSYTSYTTTLICILKMVHTRVETQLLEPL